MTPDNKNLLKEKALLLQTYDEGLYKETMVFADNLFTKILSKTGVVEISSLDTIRMHFLNAVLESLDILK